MGTANDITTEAALKKVGEPAAVKKNHSVPFSLVIGGQSLREPFGEKRSEVGFDDRRSPDSGWHSRCCGGGFTLYKCRFKIDNLDSRKGAFVNPLGYFSNSI